ncbi:MAG: DMT family transporter [Ferruginibacter sp.]
MQTRFSDWLLYILLSLIWGSSFILIEASLQALSPMQVASLRIVSAGLFMLPIAVRWIFTFTAKQLAIIFLSGVLGNLLPSFLYCFAESGGIESSFAGALNALTPVFAILVGSLFFGIQTSVQKLVGIFVAFVGCMALFWSREGGLEAVPLVPMLLIFGATACYGTNVNLVYRNLKDIPPLPIVAVALLLNALPAMAVLVYAGFFELTFQNPAIRESIGYACLLGIGGSALASILFYVLIQRAGTVFASLVTYGIPFVAFGWGIWDGEALSAASVGSLLVILLGVFLANRKPAQLVAEKRQ